MFEGQFCLEEMKIRTESSAFRVLPSSSFYNAPRRTASHKDRIPAAIYHLNKWEPTPVLLPGKSHGQRSLVGYTPWGHKELDMTERLTHTHTHRVPLRYHLHTTFCTNLKWWVFANIFTWIIHIPIKIQNISNALKNSPLPSPRYTHFPQAIHGYCSDFYHHLCIPFLGICIHGMIQYQFLCVWLLPLNIMFLRFICIIVQHWFVTFYWWILFYCMILPQFAHPVSCWWTFELLPGFDYHEKCYEHSWTNLFLGMFLLFLSK